MRINTMKTWPEAFELMNIRVIDGDTMEGWILMPLQVCIKRRIRLRGFFAPEHHGMNPTAAENAKLRLLEALEGHHVHISSTHLTEDNHGRVLAHLMIDGRITNGFEVLGDLNLTEAAHKADLKFAKGRGGKIAASL